MKQSNEDIFFFLTENIWKTNNDVQDLRVSFFPLPVPLYLSMIWLRSPLMTTAKAWISWSDKEHPEIFPHTLQKTRTQTMASDSVVGWEGKKRGGAVARHVNILLVNPFFGFPTHRMINSHCQQTSQPSPCFCLLLQQNKQQATKLEEISSGQKLYSSTNWPHHSRNRPFCLWLFCAGDDLAAA